MACSPVTPGYSAAMTKQSAHGAMAHQPYRLSLRSWWQVVRRTRNRFGDDHVALLASGVAFAWFLALFPGLIAAVMVYGLVTDPADVEAQVTNVASGLPSEAQTLLTDQMHNIANSSDQGLSVGLVVSLGAALWSTSAGVAGLVEAVNVAYDAIETRNFVVKRGLAILLALGFLTFVALAVGLIGVLPIALDELGLGSIAAAAANIIRWVGLVLMALIGIGVIYRIGPDRASPKVRWLSVGAVTATVLWVVASAAVAVFIDNFGRYGQTYGSLAGVAVLMLWLWLTAMATLLGAEINAEAEAQPARDTTAGRSRPTGQRVAVRAGADSR
jgi:membrane protein